MRVLLRLILAINKEQDESCTVATSSFSNSTTISLTDFASDLMVNESIPTLLLFESLEFIGSKTGGVPYVHLING